jgi:hypothetical protein
MLPDAGAIMVDTMMAITDIITGIGMIITDMETITTIVMMTTLHTFTAIAMQSVAVVDIPAADTEPQAAQEAHRDWQSTRISSPWANALKV